MITPLPEFVNLMRKQHAESFAKLFLEKSLIKTDFSKYKLDILELRMNSFCVHLLIIDLHI
ncbi:MAG: hypothetical protein ACLFOZ_08240 [Cyclobacteriaceae bacterium]